MCSRSDRGVVLVMVLIIASILVVSATAFIVLAGAEAKALGFRVAEKRALFACYSGLEHAGAVIRATRADEAAGNSVATPDGLWSVDGTGAKQTLGPNAGWAGVFRGGQEVAPWLSPYGAEEYGYGDSVFNAARSTKGQVFTLSADSDTIGEYAIYVNDFDGRIHTNASDMMLAGSVTAGQVIDEILDGLTFSGDPAKTALKNALLGSPGDTAYLLSLTELKAHTSACTWSDLGEVIPYFTPYPVQTVTAPLVNVNTAREATLRAILAKVPSLDSTALDATVSALVTERPFGSRRALEEAIEELAPAHKRDGVPVGNGTLTEIQFNDVLNSLCDGAYDEEPANHNLTFFSSGANFSVWPDNAGRAAGSLYEFKFPADIDDPPEQTGGAHTSGADVTWGAAVKFRSRFYRMVVLGRGWRTEQGRSRTVRRWLEVVYDARDDEILWQRIHLMPKFNILTD